MRGRRIGLLPSSRVRNDILYFANKVPLLPIQRRMALGSLVKVRAACPHHPSWTVLFLKAFAIVAQQIPELRRVYLGFPSPHLYEYPSSIGMVAFERQTDQGMEVFGGKLKDPASRSLAELMEAVRYFNETPPAKIKDFQRILSFGRLPGLLRRLVIWVLLHWGRQRANFFGTFALSVYSALGAESLRPLYPATVMLNYGVFAADGTVDVRLVYDHRVMDGVIVARALQSLEKILTESMVDEVATWR